MAARMKWSCGLCGQSPAYSRSPENPCLWGAVKSRRHETQTLDYIGHKILAHLGPETGDQRAHWLATRSWESYSRAKKSTATNEGARVHPALLPRIATVSRNGTMRASTLPYP